MAVCIKTVPPPRQQSDLKKYQFTLSDNYPNPFGTAVFPDNPSTKITYTIAKTSFVTLKVFNALGEEIKTLVSGYKTRGKYAVNFNANKLPAGVYFYTLTDGENTVTKKMILVK